MDWIANMKIAMDPKSRDSILVYSKGANAGQMRFLINLIIGTVPILCIDRLH